MFVFLFFLTSVFEDGNLYIASQRESKVTQDCTTNIYYIVLVTSLKKIMHLLATLDLSYSTWDLQSSLQHGGFLVAA